MAYTRVTRTANGAAAIAYALNGSGHNGAVNRNEAVTCIKLNNKIPIFIQFEKYWNRARVNHKTQIIRIVQSFSKNEFDPENHADILKANELGQALVDEHYPGRQAVVCTQTDGKGGCVHNHILVSDVSMVDGKGCKKEQYYQPKIMTWTDEITARYTNLDCGGGRREKLTQTERAKRQNGEYSYKDDIRERVAAAMKASTSEDDFRIKLNENGINATRKCSKKYGEYYTYELIETAHIPKTARLPKRSLKARSYKLGTGFGPQALEEYLNDYESNNNQIKDMDFESASEPEIIKKQSPKEEKSKPKETPVPTVTLAAPVVNVNEDIRQILADAYDETEEDEQSSKQKTHLKKAFSDASKSVRTKRNTYANRFDSAVAMRFDKADEIEDEAER